MNEEHPTTDDEEEVLSLYISRSRLTNNRGVTNSNTNFVADHSSCHKNLLLKMQNKGQ